ncbi:MAG: hypothetical protein LC799_18815, partial [Actinobacteria bacterium]|nr:hypothetical protein [Actinomycetota bacterium]
MTPRASRPAAAFGRQRIRSALVVALAEKLTEREWNVIETINRLRLVTGLQLERLHFAELTGKSRSVMRWRVLKRLVDWHI